MIKKTYFKICNNLFYSILLNSIAGLLNYIYQTSNIRTERQTKHFRKLLASIFLSFITFLHNGQSSNSFFIVTEKDKLLLLLLILKMSILARILALRVQLFTTAGYRASTCGSMDISAHFIWKSIFCVVPLLTNQN